jgi:hypothetical protein
MYERTGDVKKEKRMQAMGKREGWRRVLRKGG